MDTPTTRGGSSALVHARTPSLQLAKLAELLTAALPHDENPLGVGGLPLASLDGNRVLLNTRGVLARLFKHKDFKTAFEPGDASGFIRDMTLPPLGLSAKVGGRLLPGTEANTSKAIERLHEAIRLELDAVLAGQDLKQFTLESLEKALASFAASSSTSVPALPQKASLVQVQFAKDDRKAEERSHDLARVLTAIETIDGSDWLGVLLGSITNELRRREVDQFEIDAIVTHIRNQRDRPGSQIRRFLDFLEDEALARVRLQVTMRLMGAVAEGASAGLQAYVDRVQACYSLFAGPKGDALPLEVAAAYGVSSNIDLAEELRKALFYLCLPLWPEHSVQLFETRTEPTQGFSTQREVSYRFRVNGQNPQTGKSAYATRLDRLAEQLLDEEADERRVGRYVVQTVFLYLVVPDSATAPSTLDIAAEASRIAAEVKQDPRGVLRTLLGAMARRISVMEKLADEVIDVLRAKSKRIVAAVDRAADSLTVSVLKGIVNWPAVMGMSAPTTEVLIKSEKGPDTIAWFTQLVISDNPVVKGSVASYQVRIQLKERSLVAAGQVQEVTMQRDLSARTVPIRFVPFAISADQRWVPAVTNYRLFEAGCGVEVQYSTRALTLSQAADTERARAEQLRAATAAAFALLVYIALWELVRRIRQAHGEARLAATMFRLQLSGKDVPDSDGSAAIYAISQSIEKALACDVAVKLQGIVPSADAEQMKWRKRGALAALLGGQSLMFDMQGALDRVALVSYVTRPCDKHPSHEDSDGYLFLARTYQAVRENGVSTLQLDRMRSRFVDSRKEFDVPQLILEEVARLRVAGFEHVMLLSHHFGNRHIGRAADRHAPHGSLQFLEEVSKRFPTTRLYTLRRDVFPATRLRKRQPVESGFEVTEYRDHQAMYQDVVADAQRSLMPVYTFATFAVVGDESGRPQSGFCTYFYDIEQRAADWETAMLTQQDILGLGEAAPVRASLISVLCAIHFMESEKPAGGDQLLPVLDPFDWATPATAASAGELTVIAKSRRKGKVELVFPAVLAHVTKVLHKETQ
jgi:hypothetical protein